MYTSTKNSPQKLLEESYGVWGEASPIDETLLANSFVYILYTCTLWTAAHLEGM